MSRRAVLAGLAGVGGTLVLGACTSDAKVSTGSGGTGAAPTTSGPPGLATDVNLAPRFDQELFAVSGREQRLVVSFLNKQGEPPKGLPTSIEFFATRGDKPVGGPVTATAHEDGVPVAYFPVTFTPDEPGVYTLTATPHPPPP